MLKCLTVKQKPQEFAFSVNQMSVKGENLQANY